MDKREKLLYVVGEQTIEGDTDIFPKLIDTPEVTTTPEIINEDSGLLTRAEYIVREAINRGTYR